MQTIIIILLLGVIIYGYFRYVRKPKTEARPYSFVETPKIQEEPEAEQVKEEIISGTDCYTKRLRKTKRPLTFTAIDFETATTSRMACDFPMELQFYSLKDTGITNMLVDGVPINLVQQQADHSSVAMTAVYVGKKPEADKKLRKLEILQKPPVARE